MKELDGPVDSAPVNGQAAANIPPALCRQVLAEPQPGTSALIRRPGPLRQIRVGADRGMSARIDAWCLKE
jgi:hypothetical protein